MLRAYSNADSALSSSAGPASWASQPDNALYCSLAPEVQRLVAPYLTSSYELVSKGFQRAVQEIVFGSSAGPDRFMDWLYQWLWQLIHHHAGGVWVCFCLFCFELACIVCWLHAVYTMTLFIVRSASD